MIDKVNSPANIQAMLQTLKQYETEAKSGLNAGNVGKERNFATLIPRFCKKCYWISK